MGRRIPFLIQLESCRGENLAVQQLIGKVDERIIHGMKHAINEGKKYPFLVCTCISSSVHASTTRKTISVVYVDEADDASICTIYGFACKERLYQIDIDLRVPYRATKVMIYRWHPERLTIH